MIDNKNKKINNKRKFSLFQFIMIFIIGILVGQAFVIFDYFQFRAYGLISNAVIRIIILIPFLFIVLFIYNLNLNKNKK
jgi:ABC-type amino acid transport system permease subunit